MTQFYILSNCPARIAITRHQNVKIHNKDYRGQDIRERKYLQCFDFAASGSYFDA